MTFKAKLHGLFIQLDAPNSKPDTNIVFSRSRIILKTKQQQVLFDSPFLNTPILNESKYVFSKEYDKNDIKKFFVTIDGHLPFELNIDTWNKIKANIIHHRYWIDKEKDWFLKTIIATVVGALFGIWGYKEGYDKGFKNGISNSSTTKQTSIPDTSQQHKP